MRGSILFIGTQRISWSLALKTTSSHPMTIPNVLLSPAEPGEQTELCLVSRLIQLRTTHRGRARASHFIFIVLNLNQHHQTGLKRKHRKKNELTTITRQKRDTSAPDPGFHQRDLFDCQNL